MIVLEVERSHCGRLRSNAGNGNSCHGRPSNDCVRNSKFWTEYDLVKRNFETHNRARLAWKHEVFVIESTMKPHFGLEPKSFDPDEPREFPLLITRARGAVELGAMNNPLSNHPFRTRVIALYRKWKHSPLQTRETPRQAKNEEGAVEFGSM